MALSRGCQCAALCLSALDMFPEPVFCLFALWFVDAQIFPLPLTLRRRTEGHNPTEDLELTEPDLLEVDEKS